MHKHHKPYLAQYLQNLLKGLVENGYYNPDVKQYTSVSLARF